LKRLGKGAFLLGSEFSSHRSARFLGFAQRDRVIGQEFCNGVFPPYRARLESLCPPHVQRPLASDRAPSSRRMQTLHPDREPSPARSSHRCDEAIEPLARSPNERTRCEPGTARGP
jgi:hypothetical protein